MELVCTRENEKLVTAKNQMKLGKGQKLHSSLKGSQMIPCGLNIWGFSPPLIWTPGIRSGRMKMRSVLKQLRFDCSTQNEREKERKGAEGIG